MKFKQYIQDQTELFPPSIRDLIKSDDLVLLIDDIVEKIGVNEIENKYVEEGTPAYHPKMMVKIYFYAYAKGLRSSRKIAQALEENIKFWYLSGKQRPNFRTISDFRKDHIREIKHLFKNVVGLCVEMGMVSLGLVAVDGTKIKANASNQKNRSKEDLHKELEKIESDIDRFMDESENIDAEEDNKYGRDQRGDEIPEDLMEAQTRKRKIEEALRKLESKNLKTINLTDDEATTMKLKGQHYEPAYNCQTAVDTKADVIIAADSHTTPADKVLLEDAVKNIMENLNDKPDNLVADCGYFSANNIEHLEAKGINAYIPDTTMKNIALEMRGLSEPDNFSKNNFRYNPENNCYICPEDKTLTFAKTEQTTNGTIVRRYKAKSRDCLHCKHFGLCTIAHNGRTLKIDGKETVRLNMAKKIRSKLGMAMYKKRLHAAEMPFGNIKQNMGFRDFLLRGLTKIDGEFKLISTIHNIKMIQRFKNNLLKDPPTNWIEVLINSSIKPKLQPA